MLRGTICVWKWFCLCRVVFDKDEYALDENKKPLYCNRCQDLIIEILKFNGKIIEPFKVGISLGVTPLDDTEKSMLLIYYGIDQVLKEMDRLGIPVIQLENIYEPEFIIDVSNNCIITSKQNKTLK